MKIQKGNFEERKCKSEAATNLLEGKDTRKRASVKRNFFIEYTKKMMMVSL